MIQHLRDQILAKCRLLLSEINRDIASSLRGCFDRRYWAWKLIDFPEATFQRNLYPLSWYALQPEAVLFQNEITGAVIAGLLYTTRIQHKNGSFDQAYPFEQSYGAAGFLLPDLLAAYKNVRGNCDLKEKEVIETCLRKTADFLASKAELHGYISNHLAGAALGLLNAGLFFKEERYSEKANQIINNIIKHQSSEGWYPEYGGADPGYQTLCTHYMAQFYQNAPVEILKTSLEKSIEFLKYFIHADGSFGGEYGSRRTEIYYPGGIAILANTIPDAAAMHEFMLAAIESGATVTLNDIDMGNTAPLLSSSILSFIASTSNPDSTILPCEKETVSTFFPKAGLGIWGTKNYYAVAGASTGGVLKVFDKKNKRAILDDCGILGKTKNGKLFTTQITNLGNFFEKEASGFQMHSQFQNSSTPAPTPFLFLGLRVLNLTLMRLPFFNEWIKKLMVKRLIKSNSPLPMQRKRIILFSENLIEISDQITSQKKILLKALFSGGKFASIHMASARYFNQSQKDTESRIALDVSSFNESQDLKYTRKIQFDEDGGRLKP